MKKRKYVYLKIRFVYPYDDKRRTFIQFLKKLEWTRSQTDYRTFIKYM